ncbi:MAG: hypothetical protein JWQ71_1033 [Pedosphaera sp.]|nr:hypothetical protein [Pedosphaera sp.]
MTITALNNPNWMEEAKTLLNSRVPFKVHSVTSEMDMQVCRTLANQFNYYLAFAAPATAVFSPLAKTQ